MTREQAWNLLTQYNKEPFHLKHAVTLEGGMRYFANELGHADEAELWAMVGLLHDLDFEQFPQLHCVKQQQLMEEAGVDPVIIRATASHGWPHAVDIEPLSDMEKILYATDRGRRTYAPFQERTGHVIKIGQKEIKNACIRGRVFPRSYRKRGRTAWLGAGRADFKNDSRYENL